MMLKGMTAEYLCPDLQGREGLNRSGAAAAGGVG